MDLKFINFIEDRIQFYFQRGVLRVKVENGNVVVFRLWNDELLLSLLRGLSFCNVMVFDIFCIWVI